MKEIMVRVGAVACALVAAAVSRGEVARPGQWIFHPAQDGSPQALLGVVSNQNKGMLLVRCSSGKPTILLKWGNYVGLEPTPVTTRLDQGEPTLSSWRPLADGNEIQYPGDQAAYLRDLQRRKALAVRLTPYPATPLLPVARVGFDGVVRDTARRHTTPPAVDPPLEMTFDLSGLRGAILKARGSCGPK